MLQFFLNDSDFLRHNETRQFLRTVTLLGYTKKRGIGTYQTVVHTNCLSRFVSLCSHVWRRFQKKEDKACEKARTTEPSKTGHSSRYNIDTRGFESQPTNTHLLHHTRRENLGKADVIQEIPVGEIFSMICYLK